MKLNNEERLIAERALRQWSPPPYGSKDSDATMRSRDINIARELANRIRSDIQ